MRRLWGLDEISFGIKIVTENVNQSSIRNGKKIVFWSSEIGLNIIQMRLQELGMWILDSDSSCMAVACHRL